MSNTTTTSPPNGQGPHRPMGPATAGAADQGWTVEENQTPRERRVGAAWREGTLTRVQELESLCHSRTGNHPNPTSPRSACSVCVHLDAAEQAAELALDPKRFFFRLPRNGSLRERAMSRLDAAEAQLLNLAQEDYVLWQMPSILQHVRRHLLPGDPRREELERITTRLGLVDPDRSHLHAVSEPGQLEKIKTVRQERGQIVTAMRAASSAAMREQVRVRSFRNVLVVTTVVMSFLAVVIAVIGSQAPGLLPLCFEPEQAGRAVVVCPTQQSHPYSTAWPRVIRADSPDIDDAVAKTVRPWDLALVELVGLAAAAVAAAAAIRGIRGSSERYGIPIALAILKLPTGAITAFLGLMLMRGQFVPGLSALDSSAQILAWALVFGYAQQLFTRMVDQQGQHVLDSVRGASKPASAPKPS